MAEPLYGNTDFLQPNCRYTVVLPLPGEEKRFVFFSPLSPFYARVELLRQDLGRLLQPWTDADLVTVLLEESLWLEEELQQKEIDRSKISTFLLHNVVRYRAEERLLERLLLEHNFESGSETRQLRDLQIQRSVRFLDPAQVLAHVRVSRTTWENHLFGAVGLSAFVRAGNTFPFPLNGRLIQ